MSYLGRSSEFGVRSRYIYTASGSETSISGADDNNNSLSFTDGAYVDVYLNGVLLVPNTDYNTTTANTIGGLSALAANDVVEIVVYDAFNVADTVPASTGGTFNGNVTANAFYGDGSNLTGVSPYDQSTSSTGYFALPAGTTAQRPGSPTEGMIRYNTTESEYEVYTGTNWYSLDKTAYPYNIEYLVIAGGGGGASNHAGGGGAGGYRSNVSGESSGGGASAESAFTASVGTTYTVTVGAGGSGGTSGGGSNGDNSTFSTITSTGGGSGAHDNVAAGNGGSGGGAHRENQTGGSGTSGQGFSGGNCSGSGAIGGAGGGGAGSAGSPNNGDSGGNGGSGVSSSITGSSVGRAGGGGGGLYSGTAGTATDGGGAGGGNPASSGTANTGGGGGGGGISDGDGGNGGSGVVILRLPTANYSGTTSGSPTVTTDGADTILTFTSSGSYTA